MLINQFRRNQMKSIRRLMALLLAVLTVGSLSVFPASAASGVSKSDSTYTATVSTSEGGWYITTRSTKVKTQANNLSGTYATLDKGSLIKLTSYNNNWYKLSMGGSTYYVAKDNVKSAGNSFNGHYSYTLKNAAVRSGPQEACSKTATVSKGKLVTVIGHLTNKAGNGWTILYLDNKVQYAYDGNIKTGVCVEAGLTVSGSTDTVYTAGTLPLTAKHACSAVTNQITWSSSNTKVATVSSSGVVSGKSAGTATITASIQGVVSVSFPITVSPKISLNVNALKQTDSRWKNTKLGNGSYTIGSSGCVLTSVTMLYNYTHNTNLTPPEMQKKLSFSGSGIIWTSVTKHDLTQKSGSISLANIYAQLKKGHPVLIFCKNSSGGTHAVVVTGYTGTSTSSFNAKDFTINDPGYKRTTLDQHFAQYPTIIRYVYPS